MKSYRIIFYLIFPAFIFIAIGIYFLAIAGINFYNMKVEQNEPFEIEISADKIDAADMNKIMEIEGVKAATEVCSLGCRMQVSDEMVDVNIEGISPDYMPELGMSDNSLMPCMVMNVAAARMVSGRADNDNMQSSVNEQGSVNERGSVNGQESGDETTGEEDATADDMEELSYLTGRQVLLDINEKKVIGKIYKLVGNTTSDEVPYIYTSLDCIKYLQRQFEIESESSIIRIKLDNAGKQKDVNEQLEIYGYTVTNLEADKMTEWDILEAKIGGWICAGIIAIIAGLCIYRYKKRQSVELLSF